MVSQAAGFGRTTRGVVFGIEIKDKAPAGIVSESDLMAVLIDAQYVGNFVAYLHHDV